MSMSYLVAFGGGALIGLAATLAVLMLGRVAGISGIWGSLLPLGGSGPEGRTWRLAFLAGMLTAGVIAALIAPAAITASPGPIWVVAVAGVLVGFGTRLGGGCTSGHGVCGLSRFSGRSLVAVMTFMITGAIAVTLVRIAGGWS
jgi:uncharacterized membrane protein YedE/YeeE